MEYISNITPQNCSGMNDIRNEIDALDRLVIAALGKRYEYVKAAAKFKSSSQSVQAPQRFKSMLEQRRQWAEDEGLNPDVIEKMYADLVTYFIAEEMVSWNGRVEPGL